MSVKDFRAAGSKVQLSMDGKRLQLQPVLNKSQEFMVFEVKEVTKRRHDFELVNLGNFYACEPKMNKPINEDVTLDFKCGLSVMDVNGIDLHIVVPPAMAKRIGKELKVLVDNTEMTAVLDDKRTTYMLSGITSFGKHLITIQPNGCWTCSGQSIDFKPENINTLDFTKLCKCK